MTEATMRLLEEEAAMRQHYATRQAGYTPLQMLGLDQRILSTLPASKEELDRREQRDLYEQMTIECDEWLKDWDK